MGCRFVQETSRLRRQLAEEQLAARGARAALVAESTARDALLCVLQCCAAQLRGQLETGVPISGTTAQRHQAANATLTASSAREAGAGAGSPAPAVAPDDAGQHGSSSAGSGHGSLAAAMQPTVPIRQPAVTPATLVAQTPWQRSDTKLLPAKDISRQAQQQHEQHRQSAENSEAAAALTAMCGSLMKGKCATVGAAAADSTADASVCDAKLCVMEWLIQHAFGADRMRALQVLQHKLDSMQAEISQ